ncbi:MAG TPA: cytochrome b N-terminal domain-containing protein [Acidimicrobiia bacterium]|nr:cytochrome b N-terminal domain-containing protein [Acidimicrobiia bacterium]
MLDQEREALEPTRGQASSEIRGLRARLHRSEVWRSMFRHRQADTPRGRALQSFSNFFLHVYPVKIPKRVLRFRYSFRLGYIATVLFGILLLTGVYLMFVYTPSVGSAYGDMQRLKTGVGFGQLIRNVHRWSAHLMVLVVAIHMTRVFYAGAYKRPREFNWVLGVMLLLLTLAFSFTGYLLPWDQLAYWAVTVGTNLVNYIPLVGGQVQDLLIGGDQIGQSTLLRFYAFHVAVLPGFLVLLLAVHIWRVRKDGFAVGRSNVGAFGEEATAHPAAAAPAAAAPELYGGRVRLLGVVDRESVTAEERPVDDTVFTWPHLMVRHVVVGLGVAAVVLALGVAFAAPLRGLANPNLTPEPAKAPWYFAGLQELLSRFDPLVAGILVPAGAVLVFVLLPYIDRNPATEARNRKVAVVLFSLLVVLAVGLTVVGTFFRGPGWQFIPPWDHWYVEL